MGGLGGSLKEGRFRGNLNEGRRKGETQWEREREIQFPSQGFTCPKPSNCSTLQGGLVPREQFGKECFVLEAERLPFGITSAGAA